MASLRALPATFSYSQALDAGLSERQLYRLRDRGAIESIGRGLYRRHDADIADVDLIEIARRAPSATLCLTTALAEAERRLANRPTDDGATVPQR